MHVNENENQTYLELYDQHLDRIGVRRPEPGSLSEMMGLAQWAIEQDESNARLLS